MIDVVWVRGLYFNWLTWLIIKITSLGSIVTIAFNANGAFRSIVAYNWTYHLPDSVDFCMLLLLSQVLCKPLIINQCLFIVDVRISIFLLGINVFPLKPINLTFALSFLLFNLQEVVILSYFLKSLLGSRTATCCPKRLIHLWRLDDLSWMSTVILNNHATSTDMSMLKIVH